MILICPHIQPHIQPHIAEIKEKCNVLFPFKCYLFRTTRNSNMWTSWLWKLILYFESRPRQWMKTFLFSVAVQKRIRRYQRSRQKSLNKKTEKTMANNKKTKDTYSTHNTKMKTKAGVISDVLCIGFVNTHTTLMIYTINLTKLKE